MGTEDVTGSLDDVSTAQLSEQGTVASGHTELCKEVFVWRVPGTE